MDLISEWLIPSQFMPHGHCFLWTPSLIWLYVVSDGLIFLSYYTIPVAILYFVRKRSDMQFNWIFVLFSLFIFACGTTHLISILTIWVPMYWLDATAKTLTAAFSGLTAVMLWRLIPVALKIPSISQLADTVMQLEQQIQKRIKAEVALEDLNRNLERQVILRTEELTATNNRLVDEIERRKQTEEELFSQKQLAIVTLESIGDAVITTNMKSEVAYLNPVAERMTGWTKQDAIGKPILEVFRILNESSRKLASNPVDVVLAHGEVCGLANHTLLVSKGGKEFDIEDSASPIRDQNGIMHGVVLVFHDVSETRKMAHKMTYLAEHDFLTDLPNRLLLTDRITQALNSAQRRHVKAALMFIDIDHFKKINDTLGHEIGDVLLKQLSRRLQNCLRNSDTISRQGGDEFIILLPDIADDYAPAEIAEKLLAATVKSFSIDNHELNISLSIGITIYPDDGNNAEMLTKNADTAMYHAKAAGRNNYQFFANEMTQRVAEQLSLENSLQKAISKQEFKLVYQAKVSLATGKIIGVEALLRWQHPDWGLIAPDRFIPAAEDSGLIKRIGHWVLHEACRQNVAWQQMGLPAVPVAVNLSVVELRQPNFLQQVTRTLLQTGMEPNLLELEVTESIAIQGMADAIEWLNKLKNMGVKLSIDDFGTGYSSLSYLKRLPVDTIKIDKSFVRDITTDPYDAAIITAIISMSHSLKLNVIAEGVETKEQLTFLQEHGCDQMQGYLFSRPVPSEGIIKLLKLEMGTKQKGD
jgi:diguanylate cyclase (GGDEF)-like protein/PAS domain S-box-containing protein